MAANDIFKQLHNVANDNAKLIISSFITWYTFFWTLNVAALGVLYKQMATGNLVLSGIFFVLNLLGIGVCYFCWKSMSQLRDEAIVAVKSWIVDENHSSAIASYSGLLPRPLWSYMFLASAISLFINLLAWGLLPLVSTEFATVQCLNIEG